MAQSTRSATLKVGSLLILALSIPPVTYFALPQATVQKVVPKTEIEGTTFPPSKLPLTQERLGPEVKHPPRITNVQIVDLDRDGISDVLACDALQNKVFWYRQAPLGQWDECVLADRFVAPAHATTVDLDADGDLDVLVAVLGNIFPNDGYIGRVVWLEQVGDQFLPHVLLDDVRRVADIQAGDLDGDGDPDLIWPLGDNLEYHYTYPQPYHGCIWLENVGDWKFISHRIA